MSTTLLSDDSDEHTSSADGVIQHPPQDDQTARWQPDRVTSKRVRSHDINFGIGPAGTGKTYLAVACAVEALGVHIECRGFCWYVPAVEAGEKLGFLPGDLAQKIDPYLRPLYDALYEMMGTERVATSASSATSSKSHRWPTCAVARSTTAFIILDESQNTTIAQMKMFLTRIGFGSTAVITGDITQIDLPRGQASGLVNVRTVLRQVNGISFTHFGSRDVVRHPLVQKIVDAYAAFDQTRDADRRNSDRDAS